MYETQFPFWKMTPADASNSQRCCDGSPAEGWLIERIGHPARAKFDDDSPRFLQIGTGQWCSADYATWFPLQSAAQVYAKEFGYQADRDVRVVWQRRG
ncbi:MAG: hypothetical protein P1U77_05755 [Rubripirellula sp.]|nr:hypothetical protein [Rubripirellula sp.]